MGECPPLGDEKIFFDPHKQTCCLFADCIWRLTFRSDKLICCLLTLMCQFLTNDQLTIYCNQLIFLFGHSNERMTLVHYMRIYFSFSGSSV